MTLIIINNTCIIYVVKTEVISIKRFPVIYKHNSTSEKNVLLKMKQEFRRKL